MSLTQTSCNKKESPINFKIVSIFLKRELKGCITPLVDYVFDTADNLNAPPFTPADIICDSEVVCSHCGSNGLEEVHLEESMVEPYYDPEADFGEQYTCPFCGASYPSSDEAKRCCVGQIVYQCADCQEIMTADEHDSLVENSYGDIMDWYMVTQKLGEALIRVGEAVIQTDEFSIWGRKISSRELEEEPCFLEICSDLEILSGQRYSWESHMKGR